MSGGGASPALKKQCCFYAVQYQQYQALAFSIGGRVRLPIVKDDNGDIDYVVGYRVASVVEGGYFTKEHFDNMPSSAQQTVRNWAQIYGTIDVEYNEGDKFISIGDEKVFANSFIQRDSVYSNCGFVEGVARITTPVGDAACVVKNGTLYPIITEYDQATEDNWTLQDVYLGGDNEVSNLQQMVDRSGTYLAYTEDQEADRWSPIENYLHMHVKMPIVPKIGYVPAQQVGLGNLLPGLNYAVTL